jgi:hypothetical protein
VGFEALSLGLTSLPTRSFQDDRKRTSIFSFSGGVVGPGTTQTLFIQSS